MKINFWKGGRQTGQRTNIVLSDALVDTWAAAHPERTDNEAALVEFLEEVRQGGYPTFQQAAESMILGDIRDRIQELEMQLRRAAG